MNNSKKPSEYFESGKAKIIALISSIISKFCSEELELPQEWNDQFWNYMAIALEKIHQDDSEGAINEYKKGIDYCSQLIETKPKDSHLGYLYMRRAAAKRFLHSDFDQNHKEIIIDYVNAWEMLPEVQVRLEIIEEIKAILENNNDLGGDIPYWNELIAKKPTNSEALIERAISQKEIGDIQGACADWKKAAELGNKEATTLIEKYCTNI